MELLLMTLAPANPAREADAMARIRLISDNVRNAPGLLNARFYRNRETNLSYLILTTWENLEWWQKAQERHDPCALLARSPAGIFPAPPDQWLMRYIWGYSRPLAQPAVTAAHLALVRPEQAERVQQTWLHSLQQQTIEPILSFALLARSLENEPGTTARPAIIPAQSMQRPLFLNLLSWPGEIYQEDFYAHEGYRTIQGLLNNAGFVRVLKLDPL
ncbi:MAG TPA: antibiotic biosynthesis monooxygenase [Ktedonobacteraceae bacterium]|nr:antibiotic biosynthesis monooxygenase [Ktedonobacteraceae bacterium]